MSDTVTKSFTNLLIMTFNLIYNSLAILRSKNTEVNGSDAQIRTDFRTHDGHESLTIKESAILLEDFANFLLNQSGVFLLSRRIHDAANVRNSPRPANCTIERSDMGISLKFVK